MARQLQSSDKSTIFYGLLAAAIGLFYILFSIGVIHLKLQGPAQGSTLVGLCVGLVFLAGGLAVVIQTIEGVTAGADGNFSPGTPAWVRFSMHALALTVTAGLAAIGLWVAFGPGPRQFSMSLPFVHARMNELVGRAIFGFGAVLICLILVLILFEAALRFFHRTKP